MIDSLHNQMLRGYYFSTDNYLMTHPSPLNSIMLMQNWAAERSIADSTMYLTPSLPSMLELTNPWLAVQQTNARIGADRFDWQNPWADCWKNTNLLGSGSWMSGLGLGSGWTMPGLLGQSPWTSPSANNPSGSASGSAEAKKLEPYKKVIQKLIDKAVLSEQKIKEYNEALKKSTDAERLQAVREVFKGINQTNILNAVLDDDEIKKSLTQSGYYFRLNSDDETVELNEKLSNLLNSLTTHTNSSFTQLASLLLSSKDSDIIQVISHWNESHKSDSDRSIIRYVANHLDSGDYNEAIPNFVTALLNEADKFKTSSTTMAKKKTLVTKYDAIKTILEEYKDKEKDATYRNKLKTALLAMAPAFEDLYVQIRVQQASKIDSEINEKYGKEFDSISQGLIPNDVVYKATKEDLTNEGFAAGKIPNADEIRTNNRYQQDENTQNNLKQDFANGSAEDMLKASATDTYDNITKETECEGVYVSNTSDNVAPVFYTVVDGKVVVLKGVTSIDKDGNCKMSSGKDKKLEDIIADTNAVKEVDADGMIQYKNTSARVDRLISEDKIDYNKSNNIYSSKAKDANGKTQYFGIKDNKLVMYDNNNGKLVNPREFSDDEIATAESDSTQTQTAFSSSVIDEISNPADTDRTSMNEEAKKGGYTRLPVAGYYSKTSNGKTTYYVYDNGTFKEMKGVKSINNYGFATMENGSQIGLREIGVAPKKAGKALRQAIVGNTSSTEYEKAWRKLISFFEYKDPQEIYDFLKGYEDERNPIISFNSKIAAQLCTEYGITDDDKKYILQKLAEQTKKLALAAGFDSDDEIIEELDEFIENGTISASAKHFWRDLWHGYEDGRILDSIIEKVMEAYNEK